MKYFAPVYEDRSSAQKAKSERGKKIVSGKRKVKSEKRKVGSERWEVKSGKW